MKPEKAVYASCATGSEGVSACRAQPGSEIGLMPDSSALPVDILCWRPFPRQHVLSLLSRIAAPISLPHMRCGGHPLGRPMNPPVEVLMLRVTVLLARGIGFFMGSGWYSIPSRQPRSGIEGKNPRPTMRTLMQLQPCRAAIAPPNTRPLLSAPPTASRRGAHMAWTV
jgi:hypothetical protein